MKSHQWFHSSNFVLFYYSLHVSIYPVQNSLYQTNLVSIQLLAVLSCPIVLLSQISVYKCCALVICDISHEFAVTSLLYAYLLCITFTDHYLVEINYKYLHYIWNVDKFIAIDPSLTILFRFFVNDIHVLHYLNDVSGGISLNKIKLLMLLFADDTVYYKHIPSVLQC